VTRDPFFREKFTKEHSAARTFAKEYFERYPKNRYQTEIENWRNIQSANIEFTIKRLRVPIRSSPVRNIEVTIDGVTHQGGRFSMTSLNTGAAENALGQPA